MFLLHAIVSLFAALFLYCHSKLVPVHRHRKIKLLLIVVPFFFAFLKPDFIQLEEILRMKNCHLVCLIHLQYLSPYLVSNFKQPIAGGMLYIQTLTVLACPTKLSYCSRTGQ